MSTSLNFEMNDQQTEEMRPYVCQICNKRFTQKGHLMTHRRTHTGEKPYSCHICNKRFSQSSHLNTHKRIHTGEKPYYCTECGMGFCRKRRLEKHIVLHNQFVNINSKIENLQGLLQPNSTSSASQAVFPSTFASTNENTVELENSQLQSRKPSQVNHINNDEVTENSAEKEEQDRVVVKTEGEENDISQNLNPPNELTENREHQDHNMADVDLPRNEPHEERDNAEFVGADFNNTGSPSGDDIDLDRNSITSESTGYLSGSEQNHPLFHPKQGMGFGPRHGMGFGPRQGMGFRGFRAGFRGVRKMLHGFKIRKLSQLENSLDRCLSAQLNIHHSNKPDESSAQVGANNRINLVNFTSADLLTHMMSRDDVFKCDFCCMIFQDAAMYHLHKSMHDKMDVRCCNLCGKMAQDKYDFIAHFLSEHK